jgi:hypothetical protein
MAYEKKGYNPASKANLQKGMVPPKNMVTDSQSQQLANKILDEEVEYEGEMMTTREAILRNQVRKALDEGDLRSCQFLIELAGRNEQSNAQLKTAVTNPLEQLQAMMQQSKIDDRRKKAT